MDQPTSSELNLIPDFNLIPDPETGLALLAKCPAAETAEQALDRLFWHSQFTYWRNSLAGDRLAVAVAQMHCVLAKRLPPTWLDGGTAIEVFGSSSSWCSGLEAPSPLPPYS